MKFGCKSKLDYFQIYLETDDYMTPDKNYAVRLKFQYKLGDNLEGFYMSRYKDKGGNTRLRTAEGVNDKN